MILKISKTTAKLFETTLDIAYFSNASFHQNDNQTELLDGIDIPRL